MEPLKEEEEEEEAPEEPAGEPGDPGEEGDEAELENEGGEDAGEVLVDQGLEERRKSRVTLTSGTAPPSAAASARASATGARSVVHSGLSRRRSSAALKVMEGKYFLRA